MPVRWLVELPQARTAPDDLRRRLRELDETAEVVYVGPRHWMVGRVRPNAQVRAIAEAMLKDASTLLSVRAANAPSRRARVALALLGLQGFRPVAEYRTNDLDARVVRDFQVSQWRLRHTTDAQLFRDIDAPDEARKIAAQEEMRDRYRAGDAYRTAFHSNFGRAVSSVTNTDVDTRSSARTRVVPSHAA
jgi:hypothetical protein